MIDNPELEAKGKAEKIAGKVQEKVGKAKNSWVSEEAGTVPYVNKVKGELS